MEAATTLRHLYLTWEEDPSSAVTINGHVISANKPLYLYYDVDPHFSRLKEYSERIPLTLDKSFLPDGRMLFHLKLKGLRPATVYYFTIGDEQVSLGPEKKFSTYDSEQIPQVFIEGGDCETTMAGQQLIQKAVLQNPTAFLFGGDYPSNIYGLDDYKKWDDWLDIYADQAVTSEGRLIPLIMAIGNHEVRGGFSRTYEEVPFFLRYFPQGNTKKTYFSFNLGSMIKLIVLDSGHVEAHGGSQQVWLERELICAEYTPIKIALYHVPLYPSCRFEKRDAAYYSVYGLIRFFDKYSTAQKLYSKESGEGRRLWGPLFDAWNLTVAFEHHDQALKRTKLLKGGRAHPQGTLYLGDGGFGPRLQYPPLQGLFHPYFAQLKGRVHFFWKMEIFPSTIRYSAVSSSGKIIDYFEQKISS